MFIELSIDANSDVAGASTIGVLKSIYRTLLSAITEFSLGSEAMAPIIKTIVPKIRIPKPIIQASSDAPRVFKKSIIKIFYQI